MHPKYRNENIADFTAAAERLGVSKSSLYRIAERFPIRHPHRRGWFLVHRLDGYLRGTLRPSPSLSRS